MYAQKQRTFHFIQPELTFIYSFFFFFNFSFLYFNVGKKTHNKGKIS